MRDVMLSEDYFAYWWSGAWQVTRPEYLVRSGISRMPLDHIGVVVSIAFGFGLLSGSANSALLFSTNPFGQPECQR
jgi:hypothetical protein